jgi:phage baseplate assembly protein W
MTTNANLYNKIVLTPAVKNTDVPGTKTYKGFSTVSTATENFSLYDLELIKQDILNHFHVRQGERLMNPNFGTIIWDVLFEPLTEELKSVITKNVTDIINYDPRVKADQVIVTSYESGIQIECILTYMPYNISQAMQLTFDQANGLLAQ